MIRPLTWRALAAALGADAEPWRAHLGPTPPAWYARVLSGVGTWVTSLFLLGSGVCGFLGLSELLNLPRETVLLVPLGVALIGASVALGRTGRWPTVTEPLAVAWGLIGTAFLTAYPAVEDHRAAAAAVLIACAVALTFTLRDRIGAGFAVALVTAGTGWYASELGSGAAGLTAAAVTAGLMVLLGFVAPGPVLRREASFVWGGLTALFATIGALHGSGHADAGPAVGIAVAATAAAIGLRLARTVPLRVAAGVVPALLVLLGADGLVAGLVGAGLAVQRGSRALLTFTLLYLAAFSSWYYYDLELTLWAKAGTLAGSGALLLAMRAIVVRRGENAA